MDPSIVKLLEEDEADEGQYSGADVDAITAILNRDIGADVSSGHSALSEVLTQSSTSVPNQALEQFQRLGDENLVGQHIQDESECHAVFSEQRSSEHEPLQQSSDIENKQQRHPEEPDQASLPQHEHQSLSSENSVQLSETSQLSGQNLQCLELNNRAISCKSQQHEIHIQQAQGMVQSNSTGNRSKASSNISFAQLIPLLRPYLDKDKNMRLETAFVQLRKNKVSKEDFLRVVRNIVGDQKLRLAAQKLQMQQAQVQAAYNLQRNSLQYRPHFHTASQESPMTSSSKQLLDTHYAPSQSFASEVQVQGDVHISAQDTSSQKSMGTPLQADARDLHAGQTSGPSATSGLACLNSQPQDAQPRQIQHLHCSGSIQPSVSQTTNSLNMPKFEQQSTSELSKQHDDSLSCLTSHFPPKQGPVGWTSSLSKDQNSNVLSTSGYPKHEPNDITSDQQHKPLHFSGMHIPSFGHAANQGNTSSGFLNDDVKEKQPATTGLSPSTNVMTSSHFPSSGAMQMVSQVPGVASPAASGGNIRTPPKKPVVGQKKPLEEDSPSPISSKKQKISGVFLDQSIEQLNDVTAVSGVNLREEEEQLLTAPKEESRASEFARRVIQEEEDRLLLQKVPLQKKMAAIMSKCGIKSASMDVERCLSLGVEEHVRGLISNLIRLSNQRLDLEKTKNKYVITSDVRHQIILMNRVAKEEWEKKQSEEAEKQRKFEADMSTGADTKDKDESRARVIKANKEEDDKMRAVAANVAARVAAGGDDMLSKWQLMAEQARQKREGGHDGMPLSTFSSDKDLNRTLPPSAGGGCVEGECGSPAMTVHSSGLGKDGRQSQGSSLTTGVRAISLKDVICALERQPQMSKSLLLYRMYEKIEAKEATE